MNYKELTLPLSKEQMAELRVGDAVALTGVLYTLRDAGHERLLQEIEEDSTSKELPYGLSGQTIFYAGPTPERAGRPFGAIGPTTASRMDFATPQLLERGLAATIGKGVRSAEVKQACADNGCVYFVATGGVAALLAKQVISSEIIAYADLGTEALRKITVENFPVFVGVDVTGASIYEEADH